MSAGEVDDWVPTTTDGDDEGARYRRFVILVTCCMNVLIVGIDSTIVNIALPSISLSLHTSVSGLQWTVDAYTLVLASLLLLGGSIGDRFGRRRTFQTGLVVFTSASLLCSLAPSVGYLIAFRAVQGAGASMLNPVAMSIISNTFTDHRERASAIGTWGAVAGLSMGLGPIVGGSLVTTIGWRSIFLINVPIGITTFILARLFIPETKAAHARHFDPAGQVLVIAALASLTYGIIEGGHTGWGSWPIEASFATAASSLAAFLWNETRRTEPLLQLRFFHSKPLSSAVAIAISYCTILGGFLFLNSLYLQQVRGLSALAAGVDTLPMACTTIVMAPVAGALIGRRGVRVPLLTGGVCMTSAALMLTQISPSTSFAWLFVSYVLVGAGFGMSSSAITNVAVSGMPNSQAGVAAALASTSRQLGLTLGVAVLGTIVAGGMSGAYPLNLASASRPAWWVAAGCGLAVIALGTYSTSPSALASARRAAPHLHAQHG